VQGLPVGDFPFISVSLFFTSFPFIFSCLIFLLGLLRFLYSIFRGISTNIYCSSTKTSDSPAIQHTTTSLIDSLSKSLRCPRPLLPILSVLFDSPHRIFITSESKYAIYLSSSFCQVWLHSRGKPRSLCFPPAFSPTYPPICISRIPPVPSIHDPSTQFIHSFIHSL